MDPLDYLEPDIHEFIFWYFDLEDFRKATEVSPSWNKIIGKSSFLMGKLKLELGRDVKFAHPETGIDEDESLETEELISSTRLYRRVLVDFKTDFDYFNCSSKLLNFAMTLDTSELKNLKLNNVCRNFMSKFLKRCASLTKLELGLMTENDKYENPPQENPQESIPKVISRMTQLEDLKLTSNASYSSFFKEDVSEIVKFKLKRLKLGNRANLVLMSETVERNLIKFLSKQSQCLECFNITVCRNKVIKHLFNKMPAMKSLGIMTQFYTEDMQLKVNENILELEVPNVYTAEDFQKIARAVPNLQKLFTIHLTPEKLEIIKTDLPALRTLLCPNLKHFNREPIWPALWPQALARRVDYPNYCLVCLEK